MSVRTLPKRKGKIITAAGWFDDGSIRYVVYADARTEARAPCAPQAQETRPQPSRRGALAAEQADLFGRT